MNGFLEVFFHVLMRCDKNTVTAGTKGSPKERQAGGVITVCHPPPYLLLQHGVASGSSAESKRQR